MTKQHRIICALSVSAERGRLAYQQKNELLIPIISGNGMRLVVEPQAGFFSFWHVPRKAFGVEIDSAKHFNWLMIERTGLVGVHFDGPGLGYIRYAVVADIDSMITEIDQAFESAEVEY